MSKSNIFSTKSQKIFFLLIIMISLHGNYIFCNSYFQQKVNFKINVTLNDTLHTLSAFEEITYINNSPDTLHCIYFHLWPNAYSNNKTALAKQLFLFKGKQKLFKDKELNGYIDSLNFRVNNSPVKWNFVDNQTDICMISLANPLYPNDSILISTPFHVKIPKGVTSRLGHINQSYQISQWFPKPAVYDINGWNTMPYLDQGEFYSEFGNYEVHITLPSNYIVASTAILQNLSEIEKMDSITADTTWRNINYLGKTTHTPSSKFTKTLTYEGVDLHDFAWFASKEFHIDQSELILPESGKKVKTMAIFTNSQSILWKKATNYINSAIVDFSKMIGDYPYSSFTAVQSPLSAGLGMEYPGLTVIGHTKNSFSLESVLTHEIAHTWFCGALGTNERRFPYLDESFASNFEKRHIENIYPDKKLWKTFFKSEKLAKFLKIENLPTSKLEEIVWLNSARNNMEQAINLSSSKLTEKNYSLMIYIKGSIGLTYLRAYLGDSIYDSAIHHYYNKWKYKHPQPSDLQLEFEMQSGKNLNWFFGDFIGTTKRLDYEITSIKNNHFLLKNNGELNSPVVISCMLKDSFCIEFWVDGFAKEKWIEIPPGNFTELKIDARHIMPELYRNNHSIKISDKIYISNPIAPQFLISIENSEKKSLMYLPVINWNHENGFMSGMLFYNGIIIPKRFEYFVMPFYVFDEGTLAGNFKLTYNILPYSNIIQKVSFNLEGIQYGAPNNQNYHKLSTGFDLKFKPKNPINSIAHSIYSKLLFSSDLFEILNENNSTMKPFFQFGYKINKISKINPYRFHLFFESDSKVSKASLELKYKYSYIGKENGLELRFFAGSILNKNLENNFLNFSPSGRGGRELYLYDGYYPNRFGLNNESVWTRQVTISEGGLISPMNNALGYSKFLISLSLVSSLPGKASFTGIKPFVNILINDKYLSNEYKSKIFLETGLKFSFLNVIDIFFPLLVSSNIKVINGSLKERIRFVLNLDIIEQLNLNKF